MRGKGRSLIELKGHLRSSNLQEKRMSTRVQIKHDECHESPREWDNLGTMVCWHNKYTLGDEQPDETSCEWRTNLAIGVCPRLEDIIDYWDNEGYDKLRDDHTHGEAIGVISCHVEELVFLVLEKHFVILPLYLYDHSGITMSTEQFSCSWDSGQVGVIYCSLEDARAYYVRTEANWDTVAGNKTMRQEVVENLKSEVSTYDQYLTGDVYGFVREEEVDGEWKEIDSCWGFYGNDPATNGMSDHFDVEEVEVICN